ncbi:MAG TPA: DUF503 domain-containing protein [Polyangiaceae bacterium]|nr:DUF503 domain-containing protein [Polyangiaceae bacterium]
MFVGVARFVLQIPGARTLKDRRQVVRSFKERIVARLKISAAEVGDAERIQVATVGVAVVSSDSRVCADVLAQARSVAASLPEALLADVRSEVLSFGAGGSGLKHGIESSLGDLDDE